MTGVVLGVTIALAFSSVSTYVLLRHLRRTRDRAAASMRGVAKIFFMRLVLDVACLVLVWFLLHDWKALLAAGLTLALATQAPIVIAFGRKGGKFE
jgi:hypothetical protein